MDCPISLPWWFYTHALHESVKHCAQMYLFPVAISFSATDPISLAEGTSTILSVQVVGNISDVYEVVPTLLAGSATSGNLILMFSCYNIVAAYQDN